MASSRASVPSKLSDANADIHILADFKLRHRWLTMLASYIDDSGRGQRPTFVFAGFVAPAEQWIGFDDDWQPILDKEPRLFYLKTSEAMARYPAEQFKGWNRKEVDARIEEFMAVIEKHRLSRVSISVPYKHFEANFLGKIAPATDTPYIFSAQSIMLRTLSSLYMQGCRERVQFIFDTTSLREQTRILMGWHFGMDSPEEYDPLRPLIGDPPSFRDDKKLPPLQAADLYAWHLRKSRNLTRKSGAQWTHPIWERLSALPLVLEHESSATEMANAMKNIRRMASRMKLHLYYEAKPKRNRS